MSEDGCCRRIKVPEWPIFLRGRVMVDCGRIEGPIHGLECSRKPAKVHHRSWLVFPLFKEIKHVAFNGE